MLCGKRCVTRFDEFRDDVVERTAEIVYDVSEDDAESWFLNVPMRNQPDLAPARLWIDICELGTVRTCFLEVSQHLGLKGSVVLRRPRDLCLGRLQVKVDAHGGDDLR